MVVEDRKSHDLLSAGGVIQSGSEGLRTRGADGISPSSSPKARSSDV